MTQPRSTPPGSGQEIHVPRDLLRRASWIGWREWRDPARPKSDKLPIVIATNSGIGYLEPINHVDYGTASSSVERLKLSGTGFVLTEGCGLIGGDLDKCRNPVTGEIQPWALEVLAILLKETYCEISPSGAGIRFWAAGTLERAAIYQPAQVEMYVARRYLTFTGDRLPGSQLEIGPAPLGVKALLARIDAVRTEDGLSPSLTVMTPAAKDGTVLTFSQWAYRQTPMGRINQAALENLDAWVPKLFANAKRYRKTGWRVSSASLGRKRQEDISILPQGIKDFGEHDMGDPRAGKRSPIDLAVEHHPFVTNAKEAAQWLAETIGVPFEDGDKAAPPDPPPPASQKPARDDLLLKAWLEKDLPPRTFLMGSVLCTTSRWLMFGETGVGKSLAAYDIAGAVAAGQGLFNWTGSGSGSLRAMVLDGEMPAETFKERMEAVAARFGPGLQLYGYNRDDLGDGQMPPLNEEAGQAWLMAEVEAVKPDLIVFDSIMCLIGGVMSEEESWAPVKHLVRKLTSMRIAQIWLHHTGHDGSKGFGTKTREWEMDTVVRLAFADEEREQINLEFRKARLRTPANAAEFEPVTISRGGDGWTTERLRGGSGPGGAEDKTERTRLRKKIIEAYQELRVQVADTTMLEGHRVRQVKVEAIRDWVKSRGWLGQKDTGGLTEGARKAFQKAKESLLENRRYMEVEGLFWEDRPITFQGADQGNGVF